MSIRVMTAVWDGADVSGGTLVVLLAMADFAHDDGGGVYPTQETLAAKARMSERNLRNCLDELEQAGYIERAGKRRGIVEWRVQPNPAMIAARQPTSGQPGSPLPTEPSVTRQEDSLRSSHVSGPDQTSPTTSEQQRQQPHPPSSALPPSRYVVADVADLEKLTPGERHAQALAMALAHAMRLNDDKAKLPDCFTFPGDGVIVAIDARKPSAKGWLDPFRLLIDRDGRDPRDVERVLRWCQADEFWKGNILSPSKFRAQFAKLMFAADRNAGAASSRQNAPTQRDQAEALSAWINRPAGTSRADLDRRTGVHH